MPRAAMRATGGMIRAAAPGDLQRPRPRRQPVATTGAPAQVAVAASRQLSAGTHGGKPLGSRLTLRDGEAPRELTPPAGIPRSQPGTTSSTPRRSPSSRLPLQQIRLDHMLALLSRTPRLTAPHCSGSANSARTWVRSIAAAANTQSGGNETSTGACRRSDSPPPQGSARQPLCDRRGCPAISRHTSLY